MSPRRRRSAIEFGNLPDIVLLQVFRLLAFKDLCMCARVCLRWRNIARDRTLQRTIDVTTTPLPVSKMESLIRGHGSPNLVELRICGTILTSPASSKSYMLTPNFFRTLRKGCPSLKVLHISHSYLASKSTRTEMTVSELPPKLVKLSLRSCFFYPTKFLFPEDERPAPQRLQILDLGSRIVNAHLELLSQWPHLQALSLEGCHGVSDKGISDISYVLANLVVLDIEGTKISDSGLMWIIAYGAKLKYLFAGHTDVTGEAFTETLPWIESRLKSLEGLTHICLRRTLVMAKHLPQIVATAPRLAWLAVTGRGMSAVENEWLKRSVPDSCKFLQCSTFFTSETTFCHHFVSGTVGNVEWELPPPVCASCGE